MLALEVESENVCEGFPRLDVLLLPLRAGHDDRDNGADHDGCLREVRGDRDRRSEGGSVTVATKCECDNSGTQACGECEYVPVDHSEFAGAACEFGEDGMCSVCGVAEDECPMCNGIGYHAAQCDAIDEVI